MSIAAALPLGHGCGSPRCLDQSVERNRNGARATSASGTALAEEALATSSVFPVRGVRYLQKARRKSRFGRGGSHSTRQYRKGPDNAALKCSCGDGFFDPPHRNLD